VEPATVASFLGRVTDPDGAATNPIREAGFRAIMFTDVASSTEITNSLGDAKAQTVLAKHHEIVRQALLAYDGREIDRAGDGFLTCFASASQAVTCAVMIQRAFHSYNSSSGLPREIRVRIGLGAGEPLADGDALFGATVNMTARICATANPGQILAARVVRDLCSGKAFSFGYCGEANLKGFPDPIELYEVAWAA
jgi:class 3 adenylate cyclase